MPSQRMRSNAPRYPADAVVYIGGAVNGNDHIVEARGNFFRALLQQEAGRQQCEANMQRPKEIADAGKLLVLSRGSPPVRTTCRTPSCCSDSL